MNDGVADGENENGAVSVADMGGTGDISPRSLSADDSGKFALLNEGSMK